MTPAEAADLIREVRWHSWFFSALALSIAGACTYDFDAPFEEGSGSGGSGGGAGGSSSTKGGHDATSSGGAAAGGGGSAPVCGDGTIDPGEECDDENDTAGDGCDECKVECSGLGEFKDPDTQHCYRVALTTATWDGVRTVCQGLGDGFDFVVLGTMAEVQFVAPFVHSEIWLGANDRDEEGKFAWFDDEPFIFEDGMAPWAAGQPNDLGGTEECLLMRDTGEFNDDTCTNQRGVLCERAPAGKQP